ncbi:DNA mismatch endonuclease Vsr [Rhizobium laguerreae]|uniref:very short patch repair endonuclease n=1 Tax=Rhizobium laguerreae TaxID=1076926 RepID=UPI001C929628|nr:very short patch repair endonuclease [Rhizobium laguerreae]MBY3215940.1 DNA mismatch endonuclease Vsr [Rhizobium laguerreae]
MTSLQRSKNMRAIKSRDTRPEMIVRRVAHALGYRYRLHRRDLPGTPDIVFPSRKKVILVHGCFWHMHDCRRGYREPKENQDYWSKKIARNRDRDLRHHDELKLMGWQILTIWECETKGAAAEKLPETIRDFIERPLNKDVPPGSHFSANIVL